MGRKSKKIVQDDDFKPKLHDDCKKFTKWKAHENLLYARFLLDHDQGDIDESSRVKHKYFLEMSKALNFQKNNIQCRSHHQKMLMKYSSVAAIVASILGKNMIEREDKEKKDEQKVTDHQLFWSQNQGEGKEKQFFQQISGRKDILSGDEQLVRLDYTNIFNVLDLNMGENE